MKLLSNMRIGQRHAGGLSHLAIQTLKAEITQRIGHGPDLSHDLAACVTHTIHDMAKSTQQNTAPLLSPSRARPLAA